MPVPSSPAPRDQTPPLSNLETAAPSVGQLLLPLDLPKAPPVTTGVAAPLRRATWPALALVALGLALIVGTIIGGLFAKTAAGEQMINAFAPHM